MALCRDCSIPIPCHCHVAPAVEVRPGVYRAAEPSGPTLPLDERRRVAANRGAPNGPEK
ncbi:hypothetical protein [Streptomyces sp. NBC_01789]|uniref:hypothetical protein n=1 Tax=Streptomyces sp. NBC_01789 TaxID=2975941 RepID=UPI0022525827|nr:hypothetical protein [Streptomyces sp. NBC_01789]MCX4450741.1 hypothetical protein [Streptomyces sp. NBC_01789]